VFARILLAVLAPTLLFVALDAASAQVMCIRGPNGQVFCGPPAQQSGAARHRQDNEFDRGRQQPRFANRGGREDFAPPPQSRTNSRARPPQTDLERARSARQFYSERLREAMMREQELQRGRGAPPERIGSPERRRPAGERYAPPPRYTDRAPPRYADRAPPRYADRAPPQYREPRQPYPPSRVGAYPGQQRIPRTRLTEREPFPPQGARPGTRRAPYHEAPPRQPVQPAFRGPQPGPGAGRPPLSREEALEQLRRQYNSGNPNGPPPMIRGPSSPIGVDPNQPFGPPPAPQERSESMPGGRTGT
jgi:hypothetical protein